MDTFHEWIDVFDEIKEDISDQKYKHLVETIGDLKKKEKRYVLVKYIHSRIGFEYNTLLEEEEPELISNEEQKILMITETDERKAGFNHISKGQFEEWDRTKLFRIARSAEHLFLIDYEEL